MIQFVMMFILAMSLVACSSDGNTPPTGTPISNITSTTTNLSYDPSKPYPVIIASNIAQLAEVATVTITDAGSEAPTALEFAPNGIWLAVGHSTGASIFDLATLNAPPRLLAHNAKVNDVAWNSFGFLLATASDDKTVKVWDANTGEATLTITNPNDTKFQYVVISNDDSLIVAAEEYSNVYVASASSGEILTTITLSNNRRIGDITITADSTKLIVSSGDIVQILDIATGAEVRQIPMLGGVSSFELASDDKRLFIANFLESGLIHVDITTGEQIASYTTLHILPKVVLSADAQLLASFWNSGGARLVFYDTFNLQPVGAQITLSNGTIEGIAYGSDGSMIATVGVRDGSATLSIWRVNS